MSVDLNIPVLFCDNRAAVFLTQGSAEWRTKALVNRVIGLRSLEQLGNLVITYKPTSEMAADVLTKYMKKGILQKCRALVGVVCLGGNH